MTKPLVIYHADCADGFGAAFAAWLKLGDEAEYLPMNYNQPFPYTPDLRQRDLYILDFSFPRDVMDSLFTNSKRVVWLDHHKTAFEMWCGKYERGMHYAADEVTGTRHWITLDDSKSGALLAWEYFRPGTEVPMLIQHIDDRDRWQFKLEGSKELHAQLASAKPWSFEQWKSVFFGGAIAHNNVIALLKQQGAAILRAQDAAVAQAVKHAKKCVIGVCSGAAHKDMQYYAITEKRFTGLAVSCPLHQSEIGHELANLSGTFGLVWYMKEDGSIICSLRSNGDYDVSAIANAFGGGGYKNAAGFQTDVQTLMGWLK